MEHTACNLCGSQNTQPLIEGCDRSSGRKETYSVVRCAECGLAYLNPRPDAQELPSYYQVEYYQGTLRDAHWALEREDARGIRKVGIDLMLGRRTPPFVEGGRLLDVGCSEGSYLVAMRARGWEVHGVEMDAEAVRFAREHYGLDVRTGQAEGLLAGFPDNHFDVVTLWHVLEHFSDPVRILADIGRILKPGGRLMIEVPNFQGFSRLVFRTYWAPLELPRHLYHFTPRTLAAMLAKTGYQGVEVRGAPAAVAATASLQLLRNQWAHDPGSSGLSWNPLLLALAFPASWLLARFRRSAFMTAAAIKPPAGFT